MIAPHRHCIVPFLSTNGSRRRKERRGEERRMAWQCGAIVRTGKNIRSVSSPFLSPMCRFLAAFRRHLHRRRCAAYSINTRRCNRDPSIPQIDSDVRNSRNSFYHGKPAYSTAAWSADGRPLQTPPASLSSLDDLTVKCFCIRCSLPSPFRSGSTNPKGTSVKKLGISRSG